MYHSSHLLSWGSMVCLLIVMVSFFPWTRILMGHCLSYTKSMLDYLLMCCVLCRLYLEILLEAVLK